MYSHITKRISIKMYSLIYSYFILRFYDLHKYKIRIFYILEQNQSSRPGI